jgi:hypothetical protein
LAFKDVTRDGVLSLEHHAEVTQAQDPLIYLRREQPVDSLAAWGGAAMGGLILLSEARMRRI